MKRLIVIQYKEDRPTFFKGFVNNETDLQLTDNITEAKEFNCDLMSFAMVGLKIEKILNNEDYKIKNLRF